MAEVGKSQAGAEERGRNPRANQDCTWWGCREHGWTRILKGGWSCWAHNDLEESKRKQGLVDDRAAKVMGLAFLAVW